MGVFTGRGTALLMSLSLTFPGLQMATSYSVSVHEGDDVPIDEEDDSRQPDGRMLDGRAEEDGDVVVVTTKGCTATTPNAQLSLSLPFFPPFSLFFSLIIKPNLQFDNPKESRVAA